MAVPIAVLVTVYIVQRNGDRIMEWARDLLPAGVLETVRVWAPRVLVAVVVVALLVLLRLVLNALRRRVLTRVAEGLQGVRELRGVDLTVKGRRWRLLTPRRVAVSYPASLDDRDPEWRAAVESMVAYRMGVDTWKARWEPRLQRVIISAYTPKPVERDPVQENREAALERLTSILRPLFGVEIEVRVSSWAREHDPEVIEVRYQPTTRDSSEAWRRRLEQIVALKVPGQQRWTGTYDPAHDQLVLRPRPPLPRLVPHPGPSAWRSVSGTSLPYAVDERGQVVHWRIRSEPGSPPPNTIHTLAIGPTGGGKTTLLRSLVVAATGQGMCVLGCDIKRIELTPWQGWPGVGAIATTVEDIALLIKLVEEEMNRRYDLLQPKGPMTLADFREIVLILDEYMITVRRMNRWWAVNKGRPGVAELWGTDKGTRHPALGLVEDLLVLARAAGIRLVIGVQRPDAELFEAGARDSLQHRIALTRLSAEGARMMWGDSWTGTDLPLLPGRAIAAPDGTPVECQTFWVPNPGTTMSTTDAALIEQLRSAAEEHFPEGAQAAIELGGLSPEALTHAEQGLTESGSLHGVEDEVTELPGLPDSQAVRAELVVPGDRIIEAGAVVEVVKVDPVDDPSDDDLDLWSIELASGDLIELPGDVTVDRVV